MNDFQQYEQCLRQLQLSSAEKEFISALDSIVKANIAMGRVSVDDIASAMCIHSSKLRRRLIAVTGITPTHYILHIRMREAVAKLRRYPSQSIASIALECGFADHSHFTHVFHRVFGIAPLQYFNEHYNSTAKQQ